ncbi:ATP-binding cassette domain-containing protein [Streptomyces sp. SID4985]|nr:ATP-binding cassette domain-containing protein [Streptomyces sp. SID4985]
MGLRRSDGGRGGAAVRVRAESWQTGLVLTLTGVFIALIALAGGRLALSGAISLGQLVSAVGLALFLLEPLEVFAWVNAELAQGRASANRVAGVLAAEPDVPSGDAALPRPLRGGLRLRDVRLSSLAGMDLDLRPGELTGVAVTDPADAQALLHCLARETDPESGTVELDGVPPTSLDPALLRTAVLVAAHDAALFEGTLAENLGSWADADQSDSEHHTTRVPTASRADEVIRSLPHGPATLVGEGGRSLSGGALVTQEVHVFAGPLADDLRLARPDATDGELLEALAAVGTLDRAEALPEGLATVVGDGGHRLTPDRAQQLALARLWLADPPVAVPDEAKQLVKGVQDKFSAAKKAHPDFAGKTAVMATPYQGVFVFGSQDPRSRLLADLGFSLPKDLDKLIGDQFGANISKERYDLLDQDVAVWIALLKSEQLTII